MSTPSAPSAGSRRGLVVVALAFFAIVLDGYDLMIYGAMVPALLEHPDWDLTPTDVGLIGSYATFGMLVGALGVGALTDIFGRRKIIIASIVWFSAATAATALAPTPELFGLFRLIAGIGLGGVMPTAIALTVEYAPRGKQQFYNAMMFVGYSFGGVFAALAALALLQDHGFRVLLWIGAAPAVVLVPLVYLLLPESMSFLAAKGRVREAEELAHRYGVEPETSAPAGEPRGSHAVRFLLRAGNRGPLVLFSVASFAGLLLVYGLNTWLPQIMRSAGYPLGSSISFLLVLNLGAIVGSVGAAVLADRVGSKVAVSLCFVAAALTLVSLSLQPPAALLYLFVAVAGLGSIGTQILVNGYAAAYFPARVRGTAVGITLGVGRVGAVVAPLMVGLIMESDLGFEWNFYAFLLPALVGLAMIVLVPRRAAAAAEPERVGSRA
ncbi:MFS transporter [Georgenia sp. AZ-5]|uniref:MFS transporter n=1 Tax=Georgenia sp. AZ-5 TaxID=3367526 RepID=UPI00375423B1